MYKRMNHSRLDALKTAIVIYNKTKTKAGCDSEERWRGHKPRRKPKSGEIKQMDEPKDPS
jgi:hypothetical protein